MAADLAVVIVNYRAGPLLHDAVASALSQQLTIAGRPATVEAVVVDNASGPDDEPFLAALETSARILRNERNVGFGAACNQGAASTTADLVCFLNPDARLLPGALGQLADALLSSPSVGAVGPAFWGDEDHLLRLPPNDLPTPLGLAGVLAGPAIPWLGRRLSASWTRRAMAYWNAREPFPVDMLSGACLLTRRSTLAAVGGFDEGFFLYFEDADWCARVREHGLQLIHVPAAQVVHYFNQSARQVSEQATQWMHGSLARYVDKHFGRLGRWLVGAALAVARAPRAPAQVTDLGDLSQPPVLSVARSEPVGFQFSYHWSFVPHVASFPAAVPFRLSERAWSRLMPARYVARAVDLRTGAPLAHWTWVKAS